MSRALSRLSFPLTFEEALESLQLAAPVKGDDEVSSSRKTDTPLNPETFKEHIPVEEQRRLKAVLHHIFRGYKGRADQMIHLIDQSGREDFAKKVQVLRQLGVVNRDWHVNRSTNLTMMNPEDHFVFDKRHAFVMVLCQKNALAVIGHLERDNAQRQRDVDDGLMRGPRDTTALGALTRSERGMLEWSYEVLVIFPEYYGDPDPDLRQQQQWSFNHPTHGAKQYKLRGNFFVEVDNPTARYPPFPDVRYEQDLTTLAPENAMNPLLVVLNAGHKLSFLRASPGLTPLEPDATHLLELNDRICNLLIVQPHPLIKPAQKQGGERPVTPTSQEYNRTLALIPKAQGEPGRSSLKIQSAGQEQEGISKTSSRHTGSMQIGTDVRSPTEDYDDGAGTYPPPGFELYFSEDLSLEDRQRILFRDLFGGGASEDVEVV